MDWLRAYEGERGVGYLLAIVGTFAPTVLALYLLQPSAYERLQWPQVFLLACAAGGLNMAINVAGVVARLVIDSKAAVDKDDVHQKMIGALVMGSIAALVVQGFMLWIAVDKGFPFEGYLRHTLVASVVLMGGIIVQGMLNQFTDSIGEAWSRRKQRRTGAHASALSKDGDPALAPSAARPAQADADIPGPLP